MDANRFDALTRVLAERRLSRRAAISGAAGLLAAFGLRRGGGAQVTQAQCGNVSCKNKPGKCNPGCVCCAYGNGNTRCAPAGTCSPGTVVCPAGVEACAGACVAPASYAADPNNCGACGTVCAAGASCAGGVCACPVGTRDCGGRCAACCSDVDCPASTVECQVNACNPATGVCEPRNAPNTATCTGGRLCLDGVCPPAATGPCDQPSDLCAFNVRDPQTGVCVEISSCFPDACEVVTYCNYINGETNRGNINCSFGSRPFGACDQAGGCPAGTTCCGGQCRNLSCDTANCGECGYNCITRENPNDTDRFDFGNACSQGRCFSRPFEARSPII